MREPHGISSKKTINRQIPGINKTKERIHRKVKIKITAIIAALALCTSLSACTNRETNKEVTTERAPLLSTVAAQPEKAHYTFMEHSQDAPNVLTSTDKSVVYISSTTEKVSFVAENRADREAAKKINEVLTAAYDRSKDVYNNLADSLDVYFSQQDADMSVFPWEVDTNYTCIRNDGKAITVLEAIQFAEAGVHNSTTTFSYNFDPVTGEQISQVFYTPNDKASFDEADSKMYNKLIEKYGEQLISYDNVASSFVEVAQQFWYFTEDGVKVVFTAGSIAPSESGEFEIDYTKEELAESALKYFNN